MSAIKCESNFNLISSSRYKMMDIISRQRASEVLWPILNYLLCARRNQQVEKLSANTHGHRVLLPHDESDLSSSETCWFLARRQFRLIFKLLRQKAHTFDQFSRAIWDASGKQFHVWTTCRAEIFLAFLVKSITNASHSIIIA